MKHNTYKKIYYLCRYIGLGKLVDTIPDEAYLKFVYRIQCGAPLCLDNPKTYNEKLQWLKLHANYEKYSCFVDKVEAKKIVASLIGDNYVIPTYDVAESFDELNLQSLPCQFVLKCTHDSGSTIICLDKQDFDFLSAKRKLERHLKVDYSKYLREKQYTNIKPRIIVEKYIGMDGAVPEDYKFFCFNGIPKMVMIAKDRSSITKTNFYDMNFNMLPLRIENPNFCKVINPPDNFDEMKLIAEILSKGFKHVRIDMYNILGHIYFGEFTFQHWGGISNIVPKEWDREIGNWIIL